MILPACDPARPMCCNEHPFCGIMPCPSSDYSIFTAQLSLDREKNAADFGLLHEHGAFCLLKPSIQLL